MDTNRRQEKLEETHIKMLKGEKTLADEETEEVNENLQSPEDFVQDVAEEFARLVRAKPKRGGKTSFSKTSTFMRKTR